MSTTSTSLSIENAIITGLGIKLKAGLGISTDPIHCLVNNKKQVVAALYKDKGKPVEYPIVTYALTSVSQSDTVNPIVAAVNGQYTRVIGNGEVIEKITLLPVVFNFDLSITTDDVSALFNYFAEWNLMAVTGALSFDVAFFGINVCIQSVIEPGQSLPTKDISADEANTFDFTANFTTRGYISGDYERHKKMVATVQNSRYTGNTSKGDSGLINSDGAIHLTNEQIKNRAKQYTDMKDSAQPAFVIIKG